MEGKRGSAAASFVVANDVGVGRRAGPVGVGRDESRTDRDGHQSEE